MDEKIFIDSDALYALINPADPNHLQAKKINETLVKEKAQFATTNLVIYEITTLLSYRLNQKTAIKFLIDISNLHLEIYRINEELEKKTLSIFMAQTKNKTSIVDCANIAVCKQMGFNNIFSFDKIYKLNGIKRVGVD